MNKTTTLTENAKKRLTIIVNNLKDIEYNDKVYQKAIYVEDFGKLTNNDNEKSLASQLSSSNIKKYFTYKKKSDDNKKPFIYFNNESDFNNLLTLLEIKK